MFSLRPTIQPKLFSYLITLLVVFVIASESVAWMRSGFTNIGIVLWQQDYFMNLHETRRSQDLALSLLEKVGADYSPRVAYALGDIDWHEGNQERASRTWKFIGADSRYFVNQAYTLFQMSLTNYRAILVQQLDYLNIAESLDSHNSDVPFFRAFLTRHVDVEQSGKLFAEAAKLDNWLMPEIGVTLNYQLGVESIADGNKEAALDFFAHAVKIGEKFGIGSQNVEATRIWANAYRQQGLLLQQKGNIEDAGHAFAQGIVRDPSNYWNYLSLAFIFETQERSESAIVDLFDTAIRVAPDAKWPYIKAADFFRLRSNVNRQGYYCKIASQKFRSDPDWISVCSDVDA